ncbi:MAG: hypothetical protein K5981_03210, partial [Clostridia bacterium]|nr:hypothetical protein [Clostridia bacterium]
YGSSPEYPDDVNVAPALEKACDAEYHYSFAGWTDGEQTYADELPAVTESAVYTAVYASEAHDWSDPSYSWTENAGSWAVAASRTCAVCGREETEDGDVTSEVTKPAACEELGETTYTGTFANDAFETQTKTVADIPALEHEYVAVATDPTCTEQGYTTHTCSRCGDSYTDAETAALGHDYVGVVTAPTCAEVGYTTYTCSRCGDSYTDAETAALGHDYIGVVTDPTCTEAGCATYTCSRCGDSYTDSYVPALGHEWSEWGDLTASCTEAGTESRRCFRCGYEETRAVDALGHDWGEWEIVDSATCENDGFKQRTCSRCGEVDSDVIGALGHSWGAITYTWSGDNSTVTGSRQCSACGKTEMKTVDTTSSITAAPGCETWGTTTYTATFGEAPYETQTKSVDDIPPTGHSWGEPTYSWFVPFCNAQRVCANDSSHIESERVVASSAVTLEPTCTEQGVRTYTATFENPAFETQTTTDSILALGHDWDEWTRTTEPTCTDEGAYTRTCSRCQQIEMEAIDALGHSWDNAVWTWTDANGTVTAAATFTCSRCGASEAANVTVEFTGFYQAGASLDGYFTSDDYYPPVSLGNTPMTFTDNIVCFKYSFTPAEDGFYRFSSTGDLDTDFWLYILEEDTGNRDCIAADDDSGEGDNFSVLVYLEAGTVYYPTIVAGANGESTLTIEHVPSYGITLPDAAAAHGIVSTYDINWDEITTVAAGEKVYLDYEPEDGSVVYGVRSWTVTNDVTGETVPVAVDEDEPDYYSFVMPYAPVTVSASVEQMYRCSIENSSSNMYAAEALVNGLCESFSGSYEHAYLYVFPGDEVELFYIMGDPHKGLSALKVQTAGGDAVAVSTPVLTYKFDAVAWCVAFTMPEADVAATPTAGKAAYPSLHLGSNGMPASTAPLKYWFEPQEAGLYTFSCEGGSNVQLNCYDLGDIDTYEMGGGGCYLFSWMSDSDATLTIARTGDVDTYSIVIPETDNGSVSAAPSAAPAGSKVTLTATPDDGYRSMYLRVKSGDEYLEVHVMSGEERLTGAPAEYFFTMPAGNVTVEATFVPRKYKVRFDSLFEERLYTLDTVYLDYGETPDTRELEMEFWDTTEYFGAPFLGWEPAIGPVTGDAVYTAVFGESQPAEEMHHIATTDDAITASLFISPPLGDIVTDSYVHSGLKVVLSVDMDEMEGVTGVASWSVIDADGNAVSLDTDEFGFPYFTMPESDVTVSATYTNAGMPVRLLDGFESLVGSDVNGALRLGAFSTPEDPYAVPGDTVTLLFFDNTEAGVTVTVTPRTGEPFTVSSVPSSVTALNMRFSIISFTMPRSPVSVSVSAGSQITADLPALALGVNEVDYRQMWYSFTPAKTGAYSFTALDRNEWDAFVYDENGAEAGRFDEDSPVAVLVAGERYLIQFNVYSYSLPVTYILIEEPQAEPVLHPITVGSVAHGSVVASVAEAPAGYTVLLTVTPDPGYAVSVIAPEVETSEGSLSIGGYSSIGNSYVYYLTMPDDAVTVTPSGFDQVGYSLVIEAHSGEATVLVNGEAPSISSVEGEDVVIAHCGDTVALQLTPYSEYLSEPNITVNGERLKAQADGTYSFTMPAEDVSILVRFRNLQRYNVHVIQPAHGTAYALWNLPGSSEQNAISEAPVGSRVTLFVADAEDGWAVSSWNVYTADGPIALDEGYFTMPADDVWIEAVFSEAQAIAFQIDEKAISVTDLDESWQWSTGGAWCKETSGYAVPGTEVVAAFPKNAPYTGRMPVFTVKTESGADVPFVEEDVTFRYGNCWAAAFTMPDEPVIVTIDAVLMDLEELHLGENVLTITEGSDYFLFTPEATGEYRITKSDNAWLGAFMTMYNTGVLGSVSNARLVGGETYILNVGRIPNEPTQVTVTVERVGNIETHAVIIADGMEYGTIEATVSEAPLNYYVQLKAVPGSCSEFVSIHASWEGGDINLSPVSGEELTYSFSMPPGDVTVSAEFTAPAHVWSDGVVTAPTCTE